MGYRVGERVRRNRRMVKRYIIGGAASIIMAAGTAIPALADSSGNGSGYGTQPGYQQASGCGTYHGAFDAFGKDNNFKGGADGQATGAANSAKGCQNNTVFP